MWTGNYKAAIASLRHAKWRSTLTMLGIIIGVTSVVKVVSLGEGLKHQIVGQIDNLGSSVLTVRSGNLVTQTNNSNSLNLLAFFSASTLTKKDVASLEALPSVASVAPIDFVGGSASSGGKQQDNVYVVGTTGTLANIMHLDVAYGGFFDNSEADQHYAVIGKNIAQQLFGEVNPAGESLTVGGQSFVVQGVLAPTAGGLLSVAQTDFNSAIFIPFGTAQTLSNGNTNILQILVKSKSPNVAPTITAANQTLLANHSGQQDFTVLKQYELLNLAGGVLNNISHFIVGIASISLLVGGICIMDIMLASVSERTREIGIRKAIGATNAQILNQFLIEGLALTITGGLIGVIASLITIEILRVYTSLQPVITLPIMVLAVVVSVIIGIIFSVVPALKAARKDPIEALRGE